ncbi:hypothetical protein J3R82DRAFT_4265, partial [Butyriboletus roseoflavus]
MGMTYMSKESIFDLLQGLLEGVEWDIFHELTFGKLSLPPTSSSISTSTPALT